MVMPANTAITQVTIASQSLGLKPKSVITQTRPASPDAPVHAVEHHGDVDGDRADLEAAVHRLHDGEKAAEQHAGREQVRQQVDAAPPQAAQAAGPGRYGYFAFEFGVFTHASTLCAAYTLSPSDALISASSGR